MPRSTFEHTCSECNRTLEIETAWINPELYTDPEKAVKSSTWWCPKCTAGQAAQLQMLPEQQVEVIEVLDYESLASNKNQNVTKQKKNKNEQLANDAAFELLGLLGMEEEKEEETD